MSFSPDLPRVSEPELRSLRRRIITTLAREGIAHPTQVETLHFRAGEVLTLPDVEENIEQYGSHPEEAIELISDEKNGLNEIVTNYLTGMVLWGKWKDSEPDYSEAFPYAYLFVQQLAGQIEGARSSQHAINLLMLALAQEYMAPPGRHYSESTLVNLLIHNFSEYRPRYIPIYAEPIEVLDLTFARFILAQYRKKRFPSEDQESPPSSQLVVAGYQDWVTGQIYIKNMRKRTTSVDNHATAHERLREKIKIHEMVHQLSVSTNGETDPDFWMGKTGLKRLAIQPVESDDEDGSLPFQKVLLA